MQNEWKDMNDLVSASFQELGRKIADIVPDILGAMFILLIGVFIAGTIGTLVRRLLKSTGIDNLLYKSSLGAKMNVFPERKLVPSQLVGWLVKWFFILVALIAATNVLGWNQINEFLNSVILYIPNVIIAVIILVIGFIASNFVRMLVTGALSKSPLSEAERKLLAGGADLAITLFAVMAAMIQLKIATSLVQIFFTGLVFALSLALGLVFGLGGREHASRMLAHYTDRMKKIGGNAPSSPVSPLENRI